ncbi:RBBP9/YdeN family alpha/beta hydrolase [Oricola sp.]|uniref:RBBP9/YdeN family alpha/beta hydrolase n=1 Tax=Oricola sp. TaxID=1979950 RepID=UPI00351300AC
MKIKDAEILIIPGYTNSGPDHWQSRWQARMETARRVEQAAWSKPVCEDWVARVGEEIDRASRPVVLVGHSLGIAAAVHAVQDGSRAEKVRGGFFVAPPEVDNPKVRPKHLMTFGPYPRNPLPFPSFVIASRNDSFSSFEKAKEIADAWGSFFVDAGHSGHINAESGHGPWPEGLMVFAKFMKRI